MYTYFDAHCDTLLRMYNEGLGLDSTKLEVNTKNLAGYKNAVQVFALFNEGNLTRENMLSVFSLFKSECERLSDSVALCTDSSDIEKNEKPLSAILAIEGLGNQPDFEVGDVALYHELGVRFMSLVWNHNNPLCSGCGEGGYGVTELGKRTLSEMERYRIILDTSHMSDESFWSALECYSLPICATHSVSRTLQNHARNLTDEQFLEIVKRGGVCGLNFYPPFLGGNDINALIRHIEHFLSLGGEDCIGLGSDFDGMPETLPDLARSSDIYKLLNALLSLNYSEELVEKIAYRNFERLFAISQ